MTRTLYIDCVGGVAGDMLLAALVDAGANLARVNECVKDLGVALTTEHVRRHGINACRIRIEDRSDTVTHRTWKDVRSIIDALQMAPSARSTAHRVFELLAHAEGKIHDIPPDQVHFHEVGAIDAIVDICGVAVAVESLGISRVHCSPLPLGRGFTKSAHGTLPLPAPATLELLRQAPIVGIDVDEELVTPTGAALVAGLSAQFGDIPEITLDTVGYGAGSLSIAALPDVVRVLVGHSSPTLSKVSVVETNLDDLVPELVPGAVDACFDAGALDVWTVPATMKRGRPGFTLSCIVRSGDERAVAEAMLRNTTALGVRWRSADRVELERTWETVTVADNAVRVKLGILDGEIVNVAPEQRDCARVAEKTGMTQKAVWTAAIGAAEGVSGGE